MAQMLPLLLVIFVAHAVGGIAAFGSALLALPAMLILGAELRASVFILLILGLVQAMQISCLTFRHVDWGILLRMMACVLLVLPVGILVDDWLPARAVQILLACILLGASASHLIERYLAPGWKPAPGLLTTLLIIGGIVHGAFGTGGAALTVYGRYRIADKLAFRATLAALWIGVNIPLLTATLLIEDVSRVTIATSLAAIPTVLAATLLGDQLSNRLSQRSFSDVVAILLGLSGVLTLAKSL